MEEEVILFQGPIEKLAFIVIKLQEKGEKGIVVIFCVH